MASSITDLIDRVTDSTTGRPVIGALAVPGKAIGAPSVNLADATNWTTTTAIHFSIYKTMLVSGVTVKDPSTQTDWKGTLAGTTISNLTLTGGSDRAYVAGDIIELTPTARFQKDLYDLLITLFNQDATLKPAPIQTALGLGASSLNGWNALGVAPNTVTALGNRSYQMVFNATDLTGTLSPGTRLRTTRTVAAPTQCATFNGTTQSYSKVSPNGMTFTNNFAVSAWVKLNNYSATTNDQTIVSRFNGTSGWALIIANNGKLYLNAWNGGLSNVSQIYSPQSVPLNRWVHIAAQLDMATFNASPTNSYIMIDGVDAAGVVARGGTSPTSLVQAGNLEIGSQNGGTLPFPGKIAQVAIYGAKVPQTTMLASIHQGLAGTESNVISAYSLSNSINDLNTTNANHLTANGGIVPTTADSPFCGQAGGIIDPAGKLDHAIVQTSTFSTNSTVTVQVPEGCTIPTTGGVGTVVYSANKAPFGFPTQREKWTLEVWFKLDYAVNGPNQNIWYNNPIAPLVVPVGAWRISWQATIESSQSGGSVTGDCRFYMSASLSAETHSALSVFNYHSSNVASITQIIPAYRDTFDTFSAATPMYLLCRTTDTGSAGRRMSFRGDIFPTIARVENAYL